MPLVGFVAGCDIACPVASHKWFQKRVSPNLLMSGGRFHLRFEQIASAFIHAPRTYSGTKFATKQSATRPRKYPHRLTVQQILATTSSAYAQVLQSRGNQQY